VGSAVVPRGHHEAAKFILIADHRLLRLILGLRLRLLALLSLPSSGLPLSSALRRIWFLLVIEFWRQLTKQAIRQYGGGGIGAGTGAPSGARFGRTPDGRRLPHLVVLDFIYHGCLQRGVKTLEAHRIICNGLLPTW